MEVEKLSPSTAAAAGGGALQIIVRELHAKQKAYPYQLRFCVGLKSGHHNSGSMSGRGRLMFLPMSLWNATTTSSASSAQPPANWDNASLSMLMPSTGKELKWVLEEDSNAEYIHDDASASEENPRRGDVRIAFQLQKLKTSSGQHQQLYPAAVVLPASQEEVIATLHFGETASAVVVVRRVGGADVQERSGPHTYLTAAELPMTITSLSEAAEAMHLAMSAELEGSRAHKLLSEWGGALVAVGEQLAPLVEALPFVGVLVKAATKLFAAVAGRGTVMELGAEVCGQAALVLHVLSRSSVQRLITSDDSTHTLVEKLAGVMEDVVRILDEYRHCKSVAQLWSATERLSALEGKSVEMRETFTLLHQLTTFHAQAAQCNDVHAIAEGLSAMHATKVLTAEDLAKHLLPQLIALIDQTQERYVADGDATGVNRIADVVMKMDVGLRRDLNELVGNLLKDMTHNTSTAAQESVDKALEMFTETAEAVVASSNGASIAVLSATMRCLLDEAMLHVLPQAVGKAVDDAFHRNLGVLQKSLDDTVCSTWASSLQRELQDATKQVQAHTAQTIDAAQQQLMSRLDGTLKERLGAVLLSAHTFINELDGSMRHALDAQASKLVNIVREEAVAVRSAVATAHLSSQDRIAVLHLCMTEVTSELHILKRILEKMHLRLNTMYNDAGKLRDGQVELTTVLYAIPDELRKALAPDMQQLYQQLRFHETRSKAFVAALLDKAVRKAVASHASLESMQAQQHNNMKRHLRRLEARQQDQQDLLTAQHTQQLEVSHTILAQVNRMVAAVPHNTFVFSAADDDVSQLTPEQCDYFQQIPLSMLQWELRCLYFDLYATERSTVAPQISLNRMALYTSLRIVHSVASAHRVDASDSYASYEGSSMESTEVFSIMDARRWKSLLVEGRAGIGKTTWAAHMAQLQNYSSGIVVFVRLSDVALYLEEKAGSSCSTLSPRELMLISCKSDVTHTDLIDRLFFHVRCSEECKFVWLIDGLDEVISNPHMTVVLDAIRHSVGPGSRQGQLFGAYDLVVVTSREERSGALSNIEFVATVNPWTPKEAIGYIRNFFSQESVRCLVVPTVAGSPEDCADRVINTIETGRFGAFSTLPIVLEMLCWQSAESAERIVSISDLYHRAISKKIMATRTPHCSPTFADDMMNFCKDVSRTAVGVFFSVNTLSAMGSRLLRSGLVRESVGATDKKTVRFVHKSFLEYFQALYFSEHLEELCTAMQNYPVPTSTITDGIECTIFTSREDILRIVSPKNIVVGLELTCCRKLSGNVVVVDWLVGASELALYASGSPTGQNNVSCKWDQEKEPTKVFCHVGLYANLEYFLVLRPASVRSGIVPVRCVLHGSSTLIITQRLPVCDIPGHRQQRNFLQFLTDAVRLDAKKKQQLFGYLVSRLQYHHPRVACMMKTEERSLTSPLVPNLAASSAGASKAQLLSEGGLSIVTECAATLLTNHSSYAASLGYVAEGTSLLSKVFEGVGFRRKAIYEWALLPVAQHGSSVMWRSIVSRIPKSLLTTLRGTVLEEALVVSLVSGRSDVESELRNLGVTIRPALACRLGATEVILAEIRATASRQPPEIDFIFRVALVESLSSAQYDTASAVWEELAHITHATPRV